MPAAVRIDVADPLAAEDTALAIAKVSSKASASPRLFRDCARAAKRYFEAGRWLAIHPP
jgi:hypothetical protein